MMTVYNTYGAKVRVATTIMGDRVIVSVNCPRCGKSSEDVRPANAATAGAAKVAATTQHYDCLKGDD